MTLVATVAKLFSLAVLALVAFLYVYLYRFVWKVRVFGWLLWVSGKLVRYAPKRVGLRFMDFLMWYCRVAGGK